MSGPAGRKCPTKTLKIVTNALHFMVKVLNMTLFQELIFCKNDTFWADNMVYLLLRGL